MHSNIPETRITLRTLDKAMAWARKDLGPPRKQRGQPQRCDADGAALGSAVLTIYGETGVREL